MRRKKPVIQSKEALARLFGEDNVAAARTTQVVAYTRTPLPVAVWREADELGLAECEAKIMLAERDLTS